MSLYLLVYKLYILGPKAIKTHERAICKNETWHLDLYSVWAENMEIWCQNVHDDDDNDDDDGDDDGNDDGDDDVDGGDLNLSS